MSFQSFVRQTGHVLCAAAALLLCGCAEQDPPPYFAARITDVYREQTTVEHFSLLYWWEERGETPFLKPQSHTAKEVIVEVLEPLKDDPTHVTVKTERIAFDNLGSVDIVLTETGKNMLITAKDGRRITAGMSFPKCLKVDPASGFADTKIYARGLTKKNGGHTEFKLALEFVKQITILGTTDR